MSSSKLITGLFIGAAAGLMLGILFAPDKGTVTRKKIAEKASDLTDELKDILKDLVNDGQAFKNIEQKGSMLESEVDTEWSV